MKGIESVEVRWVEDGFVRTDDRPDMKGIERNARLCSDEADLKNR